MTKTIQTIVAGVKMTITEMEGEKFAVLGKHGEHIVVPLTAFLKLAEFAQQHA